MQREARKYLSDIQQAVMLLAEFTAGKQFSITKLMQCCVQRWSASSKLLVSLSRNLRIWTKTLVARISEYPRIIAFRQHHRARICLCG